MLLFLSLYINSVNFNKSDTSKPSKHLRLSVPGRSPGQLPASDFRHACSCLCPFHAWVCHVFGMSVLSKFCRFGFIWCLHPASSWHCPLFWITWPGRSPWSRFALGLNDPNVVKGLDAYLCYLVFGLILSSSPKIGGLHTRYTSAEKIEKGQQCRVGWEATSSVSKDYCHQKQVKSMASVEQPTIPELLQKSYSRKRFQFLQLHLPRSIIDALSFWVVSSACPLQHAWHTNVIIPYADILNHLNHNFQSSWPSSTAPQKHLGHPQFLQGPVDRLSVEFKTVCRSATCQGSLGQQHSSWTLGCAATTFKHLIL